METWIERHDGIIYEYTEVDDDPMRRRAIGTVQALMGQGHTSGDDIMPEHRPDRRDASDDVGPEVEVVERPNNQPPPRGGKDCHARHPTPTHRLRQFALRHSVPARLLLAGVPQKPPPPARPPRPAVSDVRRALRVVFVRASEM